jgi:tetratricopeptide (TPR) repeat protein
LKTDTYNCRLSPLLLLTTYHHQMTVRLKICLFTLFLLSGGTAFTQRTSLDSVRSLLRLTQDFIKEARFDDAKRLASNALIMSNKGDFGWGIGEAQNQLGQVFRIKDENDSAITYFQKSAQTFERYKLAEKQARSLMLQARLVQAKRLYEEAAELHFKVLNIYNEQLSHEEATKNLDIKANTLERMAVLLTNQKQYDQAEIYALEAYQLYEKIGDKGLWEMCCTAVGNVYYWKNQFDKAAIYYQKAVDLCYETGRKSGRPHNNLAIVLAKAHKYDEAIANYMEAIGQYNINPQYSEKVLTSQTYSNIGETYFYKKDYAQAKAYLLRGIDSLKALNSTAGLSEAYETLVSILEAQGDFKTALSYEKGAAALKDSMFYKRRQSELLEWQTKFDNEKKTKDIQLLYQEKNLLSKDNALRDLQLQRQNLDLTNQRLLIEKDKQTLEVLRQSKALQEAQLQRAEAAYEIEKQAKLTQTAELDVAEKDRQIQRTFASKARAKMWILGGLLMGIVALGTALWQIFNHRQKAVLARNQVEKLQIEKETQQALQESEMKLLRSQMNPHFMFNVLNSIHRYVLENDAQQASAYLTKFSRLMRLVLENSKSEMVTLENELTTLTLYLDLEALRFKDKISYSLTVDPSVDKRFTRLPPLIIQPYVENAIWHGLMHRDEGGNIDIHIKHTENHVLEVIIQDDGIGRQAAMALKSKSATDNKSFGMQITSERLALVNTETIIEITDLKNEKGKATGTKVILKIPC